MGSKSQNILMLKKNSIAVICPFHNSEKTILRAAKSIFNQTYIPDEVFFVNDYSKDNSLEKIQKYLEEIKLNCMVHLISIQHSGPGHARNVAIEKCTSDWISFLDADDYWQPEKLQTVLNYINKKKDLNFITHDEYSFTKNFDVENTKLSRFFVSSRVLSKELLKRNFLSTSACTISNDLLRRYFFDPYLSSCQDYELWLAMSPFLKISYISIPLGFCDNSSKKSITNSNQLKRFRNLMIVIFRYHNYVSFHCFVFLVIKHFIAFLKRFIKS